MIGDSKAGKTSILYRLTQNFIPSPLPLTSGATFTKHTISVSGFDIELGIWDTEGSVSSTRSGQLHILDAQIVMIIYDVRDRTSFENVSEYHNIALSSLTSDHAEFVLVANKCETEPEERQVSHEEGLNMANQLGAHFHEVSSLSGIGVTDLFALSCYRYLEYFGVQIDEPQHADAPKQETQ
ncbi:hypothetical protein GPJ56_005282 [Histomonas meleagridis]|uniref:uncharacterized protein n=1 Tax=Histomonas meleagridis TaxID=135588 RepID=UPI00355A877D|nr:hypothetical protein GPJ56_005282 [Histomonas meleagridis]KAH0802131.1 hypothetical protein GO595_005212 [Histomonas meleagridis]